MRRCSGQAAVIVPVKQFYPEQKETYVIDYSERLKNAAQTIPASMPVKRQLLIAFQQ